MAWGLPDLKGALVGLYEEKIKPTVEQKSAEFKSLVQENMARGANTQQAIVAILLAVFLLLALAFFWKEESGIQWKYSVLGCLIGYLVPYVLSLKPQEFADKLLK